MAVIIIQLILQLILVNIFPPWTTAPSRSGLPHYRGFTVTLRHTTLGRNALDGWSARRTDLYLTTQNTKETDIQDLGKIRTHNPRKREAENQSHKPCGQWYRLLV